MLAHDYPDDKLMQVSHETIYQCLYVQTRGSLRADLHKCLSTKRSARKPRGHRADRRVRRRGVHHQRPARPRPPTARCPGIGKAI